MQCLFSLIEYDCRTDKEHVSESEVVAIGLKWRWKGTICKIEKTKLQKMCSLREISKLEECWHLLLEPETKKREKEDQKMHFVFIRRRDRCDHLISYRKSHMG